MHSFQEQEVDKILELHSSIVQISVSPNEVDDETKLLISTEAKTIICDSVRQSFVEVGSEPR